jgi:extracellular elastinolytic metalloproteinase
MPASVAVPGFRCRSPRPMPFGRRLLRALAPCILVLLTGLPANAALNIEDLQRPVGSSDVRSGTVAPLPAAVALVQGQNLTARWNRFGTVHVLHRPGGFIATGLTGDPEAAARGWMKQNRALFRLSEASIDALELYRDVALNRSTARVLLFRQVADGVPVAYEGRIKIGLVEGQLFWVASSSIGDIPPLAASQLTPTQAWLAAAAQVLTGLPPIPPASIIEQGGWTLFEVPGFSELQRARPGIVGLPGAGAVPVFETNVVNRRADGLTIAYTAYVDAASGAVLVRQDRLAQHAADDPDGTAPALASASRVEQFTGEYPPLQGTICGPCHGPYVVGEEEAFARIVVTAVGANPVNDFYIDVFHGDAECAQSSAIVAHGDSGTNPEVALYQPPGGVPAGEYYVEVCPFNALQLPLTHYVGTVLFEETATPSPTSSNPRWSQFQVTPAFDHASVDTRTLGCWFRTGPGGALLPECDEQFVDGSSHNIPWDYIGSAPSGTTSGNNARTYEGWNAAIGGASPYQPPPNPSRDYVYPWANTWFEAACDPTVISHLMPAANDIDAAVTNLFALHNRLHDFAYQLGLRERTGVAQTSNYGQTEATREGDAELGFAQAGAITGGFPSYLGRDNANQATLQDGVPPFSNMYLWQTIGGTFYAPCVDGSFDGQIIAHEYGHLVQNRMTDPDQGLNGQHGRSMGEGWADMNSVMFFDELGLIDDASPSLFSVGAYVTGDIASGIRNFPISSSPLNFSNVGYDIVCEIPLTSVDNSCTTVGQVHADSEIWTAAHFELRRALVERYDQLGFAADDALLKRRCAEGVVAPDRCGGQRRWSQVVHDGMILQPSTPTFVDARDAILAADLARAADSSIDWPDNQREIWTAFARRGLGEGAAAMNGADVDPVPGFATPMLARVDVTFDIRNLDGEPVAAEVYVGRFEARSTVAADTDPDSPLGATLALHPGEYEFLVRADGYGHFRMQRSFTGSGAQTMNIQLAPNLASLAAGAVASGDGEDHADLIDDTEATTWSAIGTAPSVDVAQPAVTVALAGGLQQIERVQVSGLLEVMLGAPLENRFSSIHQFALAICNEQQQDCTQAANYTEVYVSPLGAFPSRDLRPVSPDMTLREFRFDRVAASHVRFTALHNKCTGTPAYHGYLGVPGQEDADPTNVTDCRVTNGNRPARTTDVRAAELQVFGADSVLLQGDAIFHDGFEG